VYAVELAVTGIPAIIGHVLRWEKQSWEVPVYWIIAYVASCQCWFALHECSLAFVQLCTLTVAFVDEIDNCWSPLCFVLPVMFHSHSVIILYWGRSYVSWWGDCLTDILKLSVHIYMGGPGRWHAPRILAGPEIFSHFSCLTFFVTWCIHDFD